MISLSINGKRPGSDLETKKIIYDISPNCFWCGKKTYLWEDMVWKQHRPQKATIDHVYSKKDKRRNWFFETRIASPIILSCYRCNHGRCNRVFEEHIKVKLPKERNNIYIFTTIEKQIDLEILFINNWRYRN